MGQQGRAIGANPEPRRVAKARHPARPHHHMQAGGKQCGHQHFGGDRHAERAEQKWHGKRCRQSRDGQPDLPATGWALQGDGLGVTTALAEVAAQQPVWAHNQHGGHHHEHQHQSRARQHHHAKGLQHPDEQRGQIGTRNAAQPADHDDHEGLGDHHQIDLQIRRSRRQRQHPAQSGKARPECEYRGE